MRLVLGLTVLLWAASRPAAADDANVARRLIEQWGSFPSSITTAHIRYRSFVGNFDDAELTPEVVDDLLLQADLAGDPDAFRGFLENLIRTAGDSSSVLPAQPWKVREYQQLGERCRDAADDGTVRVIDSEHDFLFEPGTSRNQATLSVRGGSPLLPPGLHLFFRDASRGLPPDRFIVRSRDGTIVLEIVAGDSSAAGPADWLEVDAATGLMTREVGHHRGQRYREHRQLGLTEYAGGVVLPAVSLTLEYRNGSLQQMSYRGIESAEFNGPVDEGLFQMPVAADTVVVDRRGAEDLVVQTRDSADDVVSFLAKVAGPPPGPPPSRASLWRWLLTVNGIALLLIAMGMWRRSRLIDPPTSADVSTSAGGHADQHSRGFQ